MQEALTDEDMVDRIFEHFDRDQAGFLDKVCLLLFLENQDMSDSPLIKGLMY